jgi:hypothetical protein
MYALFKYVGNDVGFLCGNPHILIDVTLDGEPFKMIDRNLNTSFDSRCHSFKHDLYFKIRYESIVFFNEKSEYYNSIRAGGGYFVIDPDPNPEGAERVNRFANICGYESISHLKRDINLRYLLNN